jgi:chorismate mutase/prephenate dehydratase
MDLAEIRGCIDEVDDQLLKLFCERMRLTALVAALKFHQRLPLSDCTREKEIIGRAANLAGREYAPYAQQFFSALFAISKDYQVHQAVADKGVGSST